MEQPVCPFAHTSGARIAAGYASIDAGCVAGIPVEGKAVPGTVRLKADPTSVRPYV
jgi:hypothetical protein